MTDATNTPPDAPAKPSVSTEQPFKWVLVVVFACATLWVGWRYFAPQEDSNFFVRTGDLRLTDGLYIQALINFDKALVLDPNHVGAKMGKAIALMQSGRDDDAKAQLTTMIDALSKTVKAKDKTSRAVLAAALANRGIIFDRKGQHDEALNDYVAALRHDAETVEGPSVLDKILHNPPMWSSVRDRAIYLHKQLKLPEGDRLLRVPHLDDTQRMHKP